MYAIVDIAGQQFKVEKTQKIYVHRLEGEAGSKLTFEKVLLIDNDGKVTVGNPVIKDAAVSATVIEHVKGDKVLVFKKKRRKGYRKLNGHRQFMTRIEITGIEEKAARPAVKAEQAKKEEAPVSKPAAAGKKTAVTAEKKETISKPAAASKTAAKKPAADKPAAKKPAAASKTAAKKPAAKKPAAKKSSGDSEKK